MKKSFVIAALLIVLLTVFTFVACSKEINFSVSFEVDGAIYKSITTMGNKVISMPANPTKENYVFDGWYWDKEEWERPFTANSLLDAPISDNMTVYAKWLPKAVTYTITFDTQGGTEIDELVIEAEAAITLPNEPNKENCIFDGWYLDKDTWLNEFTATSSISEDITVYAKWLNDVEYTITFESNDGGEVAALTAYGGSRLISPSNPLRIGYVFEGWYLDNETFDILYEFTFMPDHNITLYAKWTKNNTEGISFTLHSASNSYFVTGYDGEETSIVIPKTHNDLQVTSINVRAFEGNINLTEIYIPNTITSLGASALSHCVSLERVFIEGAGLLTIGANAFSGCLNLQEINIPNSLTSIGSSAFSGCSSLTSLTLPFVGGTKAASTPSKSTLFGYIFGTDYYADGVEVNQKFSNSSEVYCIPSSLQEVIITGGEFLYGAFYNCAVLKQITIPDSVTTIGNYAFYGCSGLTSITIPNSVTSLGQYSFKFCSGLTSITIPDSVTTIGYEAFSECSGLTSVIIGKGVTKIDHMAFCMNVPGISSAYEYKYIDEVHITDIAAWCAIFFSSCANPLSVAKNLYLNGELITDLVIPNNVTSIGDYAFANSGLTSVTIPDSVKSIGSYAFEYCNKLVQITNLSGCTLRGFPNNPDREIRESIEEEFVNILALDDEGYLTYTAGDTKYLMSYLGDNTELDLRGKDINAIYQYAFSDYTKLTTITIPDSVTTIGQHAFADSYFGYMSLHSIIFGKNSQLVSIGNHAFSNCNRLTSITIPDSVTTIGNSAFYDCNRLTSITIPDSVTTIGNYAFSDCYKLVQITNLSGCTLSGLPNNPDREIRESIEEEFVNILALDDEGYLTYTAGDTKYLMSYLGDNTELDLRGKDINAIYQYAFLDCTKLTSVTIPNSVTTIGRSAFLIDRYVFYDSNLTIYVEAASKPQKWDSNWNPHNRPIIWDYKGD